MKKIELIAALAKHGVVSGLSKLTKDQLADRLFYLDEQDRLAHEGCDDTNEAVNQTVMAQLECTKHGLVCVKDGNCSICGKACVKIAESVSEEAVEDLTKHPVVLNKKFKKFGMTRPEIEQMLLTVCHMKHSEVMAMSDYNLISKAMVKGIIANSTKEDVMKQKLERVIYNHVPTKVDAVMGLRIRETDGALIDEVFEIPVSNAWYGAVKSGDLKPIIFEGGYDRDKKRMVLSAVLRRFYKGSEIKYGQPKFFISKSTDKSRTIGFVGFRKDLERIVGGDFSYKQPVIKGALPTFSQTVMEIKASSIDVLKLRIIDAGKVIGYNDCDGHAFIQGIKFMYNTYVSDKGREEGKVSKQIPMDMFQARLEGEGNPTIKVAVSANTRDNEGDISAKRYGVELDGCHGTIEFDNLKLNTKGYKHGDVLEIKMSDWRIINYLSPDGVGNCGVQLQCVEPVNAKLLLEEARPEHNEPGIAAKGEFMKRVFAFQADAIKEVISSTSSMSDTPLMEIKVDDFRLIGDGKNRTVIGEEYAPRYKSIFNQLCSRIIPYFRNKVLKVRTSNSNHYFRPHPSGLLDTLEQRILKEYGEQVNIIVASRDPRFVNQLGQFKHCNIGRAPFVGPASLQEVLCLRVDEQGEYILDPARLRAKEGTLVLGLFCGITVSYGFIKSMNGDYDGDMGIEVFSNVACFPACRPENFYVKSYKAPLSPVYLSDQELLEGLITSYDAAIESQNAIGSMDNFSKLLHICRIRSTGKDVKINGVMRKGKALDPTIANELAKDREDMIASKKHVIDVARLQEMKSSWIARCAPDGRLPKGDARPESFLLTHNTFGMVDDDSASSEDSIDRFVTNSKMVSRIITLIERVQKNGVHYLDPYGALWTSMFGIFCVMCESDAQTQRNRFFQLWSRKEEVIGVASISRKTVAEVESFASLLNGRVREEVYENDIARKLAKYSNWQDQWKAESDKVEVFSGYRFWSAEHANLEEGPEKDKAFADLFEFIRTIISTWLDKQVGKFWTPDQCEEERFRSVRIKLLTLCLGNTGFGSGFKKQSDNSMWFGDERKSKSSGEYSFSGYSFWCLDKAQLKWAASMVKKYVDNK